MGNVLDAPHSTAKWWRCFTHMTIMNCFRNVDFILNQIHDGEDVTELSIAKDD
jgi:hypothetical protein